MALSNKEKQAALRKRRSDLGQKELRNVWVTDEEEKPLRTEVKAILKEMRKPK